jgi:hypothetical protein
MQVEQHSLQQVDSKQSFSIEHQFLREQSSLNFQTTSDCPSSSQAKCVREAPCSMVAPCFHSQLRAAPRSQAPCHHSYQDNTLTFKSSNQSLIPSDTDSEDDTDSSNSSTLSSQVTTRIQGTDPSSNDRINHRYHRQRLLSRGSVTYWNIEMYQDTSWVLIAIVDLIATDRNLACTLAYRAKHKREPSASASIVCPRLHYRSTFNHRELDFTSNVYDSLRLRQSHEGTERALSVIDKDRTGTGSSTLHSRTIQTSSSHTVNTIDHSIRKYDRSLDHH